MLKRYLSVVREKRMAAFLLVLWMAVIFSFSSFPGAPVKYEMSFTLYLERKGAHVFEFFLLALLVWNTLAAFFPKERKDFLLAVVAASSLFYSFLDETHQLFVPGREGRLADVLYDSSGIMLAIAIILFLTRERK